LQRDDAPGPSPWLNIDEAGAYARVGRKVLYKAIAAGRLRAAHVDGRRKLIIHREWLDAFLAAAAPAIVELPRRGIA
jgi:excisionase family DNA binding protein